MMNVQAPSTPAEQALAAQMGVDVAGMPALIKRLRQDGRDWLQANGLPHRRVETWKYTDLRVLFPQAYAPASRDAALRAQVDVSAYPFADVKGACVVLVNGFFRADLSDLGNLSEGIEVCSFAALAADPPEWFAQALGTCLDEKDRAIAALNGGLVQDGIVIRALRDVQADLPIHIVRVADGENQQASATRNMFVAEQGAKLLLTECHLGSGQYQVNHVSEFFARDNALIDHVRLQQGSSKSLHLSHQGIVLGTQSRVNTFTLTTGGAVTRNQISIVHHGEFSHASASGAFLLRDKQHCDSTLVVDHAVANCSSSQLYKGVLDGASKGVFQGKIVVRPHAQKTDGYQSSRALLLSDTAEMNSKPELEIFADDVKCSHGSTTGKIDEDLLFYLRARGIPERQAEVLLVQAFIGEAIETVENEQLRAIFLEAAEVWLSELNEE